MAKLTEKRLYLVTPQPFTANGDSSGKVTIADTRKFVVGHIVVIKSNTQPHLTLKVKRIVSLTEMFVGPEKEPIQARIDLSAYLVADTATVQAAEQNRPSIPEQDVERNTYAEEPAVARRVILVDELGDYVSDTNPLPVDATVVIPSDLAVRITAEDNDPDLGDIHSSVRISDGTDELQVNPDGSINVVVTTGTGADEVVNPFNSITSVPSGVSTSLLTYTVPAGKTAYMFRIEVGGDNIAQYDVNVNAVLKARRRTYFGGQLADTFEFAANGADGYKLLAGDIVQVYVFHNRPMLGNFEARLQATLI